MMKSMWYLSLTSILATTLAYDWSGPTNNPVANILPEYKIREGSPAPLSLRSGALVEYRDAFETINTDLLRNEFVLEMITHLDRERIPARTIHSLGSSAFGYFEVTHDISHICKAKLFSEIGKKTPIAFRISLLIAERGAGDVIRDSTGLALKFYTEDGNWDLIMLSSQAFAIKDPTLFTSFIHSLKPNPKNNLPDPNMRWDFFTQRPESATFVLNLYSNRGTPNGYRHIPGYSIHTYQVINNNGEISFMRFHLLPNTGIQSLSQEESDRIAGSVPDFSARDLYNSIENGDFPTYTLGVQVLTLADVQNCKFDPFDMTKYLPEDEYPVLPVGRLVLNENPTNNFAQSEQLAFSPASLVPGILGAPDKIFEARLLTYRDAQHYRLGINFNKLPVNCPLRDTKTYLRDGFSASGDNEGYAPNYFPNSFNGPVTFLDKKRINTIKWTEEQVNPESNILQAREYYHRYLTKYERETLPGNIVLSLRKTVPFIQERALNLFYWIDQDLGNRIARGLNHTTPY